MIRKTVILNAVCVVLTILNIALCGPCIARIIDRNGVYTNYFTIDGLEIFGLIIPWLVTLSLLVICIILFVITSIIILLTVTKVKRYQIILFCTSCIMMICSIAYILQQERYRTLLYHDIYSSGYETAWLMDVDYEKNIIRIYDKDRYVIKIHAARECIDAIKEIEAYRNDGIHIYLNDGIYLDYKRNLILKDYYWMDSVISRRKYHYKTGLQAYDIANKQCMILLK